MILNLCCLYILSFIILYIHPKLYKVEQRNALYFDVSFKQYYTHKLKFHEPRGMCSCPKV